MTATYTFDIFTSTSTCWRPGPWTAHTQELVSRPTLCTWPTDWPARS
jgi:hypothetical protein